MIRYLLALVLALIATPLAAQTITVQQPFADKDGDGQITFGTANKRTYGVPSVTLRGKTPEGWVYCGPKGCDAPEGAQGAPVAVALRAPAVTSAMEPGGSNKGATRRTNLHQAQAMDAYNFKSVAGDSNVVIRDVKIDATRALVYNAWQQGWKAPVPEDAGSIRGLLVERVQAKCAKYCIKITRPSRDIVIRDFAFTGGEKRTDSAIAVGISFGSTARDILVENGTLSGFYALAPGKKYEQGDCLSTERGNVNVTIRNVTCENVGDGGFDLKSSNTRLENLTAINAGHYSFRIWAQATAGTLVSINPGWGHVQGGSTTDLVIDKLVAVGPKPLVVFDKPGGKVTIKSCDLSRWTGTEKVKGKGTVSFGVGC